jgi:predicted DNA-binding transcriptional regulator YafY
MAQNKNALIRYRTIDKCLQNRYRKWTLNDLIEACSDALYEYEGKDVNVSKRTVQLDIQLMRSDKLGYNAPIIVYEKRYYKYENPSYSITDIPLTDLDMNVLSEAVEMLKQFKDFSLFSELGGIIQRLEDRVYTEKTKQPAIIHLDKNENLKNLHHLDALYQSILKRQVLTITYQSFSARHPARFDFHPYIIKEFNNRWFLVGKKNKHQGLLTLALDRLLEIEVNSEIIYQKEDFDADDYYKNTYGVTVINKAQLIEIELLIDAKNAPYVLTKPFHHSQELIEKYDDRSIKIKLLVHHNYEIERLLLGFGEGITILKPRALRQKIEWKLRKALEKYRDLREQKEEKNMK